MDGSFRARLYQAILLLAALALPSLCANSSQSDPSVLLVPPVVDAGSPVTVQVSLANASWPSTPECYGPGNCSWNYFRTYVQACPRYAQLNAPEAPPPNSGITIIWETYCYIQGCVATNVTSFNVTIPVPSFPSSTEKVPYPYSLSYGFFNISKASNGSAFTSSLYFPIFNVFDGSQFTLQDGTGNFSSYAQRAGAVGLQPILPNVPCDRVPCVETCQELSNPELSACVDKCLVGVEDVLSDCIVKNATVDAAPQNGGGSSSTTTTASTMTASSASSTGSPAHHNQAAPIRIPSIWFCGLLGAWILVYSCNNVMF